MIYIFMTCTLLLAYLIPMFSTWFYLIAVAILPNPNSTPPLLIQYLVLLIKWIPSGIIVLIFLNASNLKSRLPQDIPGKYFMIFGLLLTVLGFLAELAPTQIQGLHRSNFYLQLLRLISSPATIFLVIGLVKVLIATSPNPSFKRDA